MIFASPVLKQIEPLDAIRDHQRIAFLTCRVDFPWDTTRALEFALFRTFAVPSISALLHKTREFEERPQKRYDDTDIRILLDATQRRAYDKAEAKGRAQGKAEAFLFDQMSTLQNWRKNSATTRALLTPFQTETWAIGLRKGNDDLRAKVNAFLADYRAKGGFDQLGDKWLAEQKAEFKKLGVPFVF